MAEEDSYTAVEEVVPEGVNGAMMRDFMGMMRKLRGEHEGRKEAHWCEFWGVALFVLGFFP